MNYKILFLLILFFCKNSPENTAKGSHTEGDNATTQQATVTPKTDTPIQNFTVVARQQVGLITSNMTEADIKRAYGDANVTRVDRGDVKTAIYANTPNELEISWKKGYDFKKLETAIIRKGHWKTAEGIGIGTTVEELNTINGKKIELFALEDGMAIVRWKNGTVNPNLKVMVNTDTNKVIEMQIDF